MALKILQTNLSLKKLFALAEKNLYEILVMMTLIILNDVSDVRLINEIDVSAY